MRLAFVRVNALPLAAWTRTEPELQHKAAAVLDVPHLRGAGRSRDEALPTGYGMARVLALTGPARGLGVRVGQTGNQARAVAPDVRLLGVSDEALRAARAALVDAVTSVGPKIEQAREGLWVEVSSLLRLYPDEPAVIAALGAAARSVGLKVSVGVASSKGVAALAARKSASVVVEAGHEAAFLAPLSLDAVPMSDALRQDLVRFGVKTLGEVARLPLDAAGARLGDEAARLVRLVRGLDDRPLVPEPTPTRFEEVIDLEWEVSQVEPLLFAAQRLLGALVGRLGCRALAVGGMQLELHLSTGICDARRIAVAAPTREVATLVKFVQGSLTAHPPVDAVTGLKLTAFPRALRPAQLGLFDPPGPAPERLALTLTRLVALVGATRVGAPEVPDTHRPQAVAMASFDPPRTPRRAGSAPGVAAEVPPDEGAAYLALHVFRPPREASVRLDEGRIVAVDAGAVLGRVKTCGGPWRIDGAWWGEAFDHEGYDVELDDGSLYLLAYDRRAGRWLLDGRYE